MLHLYISTYSTGCISSEMAEEEKFLFISSVSDVFPPLPVLNSSVLTGIMKKKCKEIYICSHQINLILSHEMYNIL